MEVTKEFEIERRLGRLEGSVEGVQKDLVMLKSDIRQEQTEMKDAIKELAKSNTMLATSMIKIESGVSVLVKAIPFIFTIIGAGWAYNTFVLERTDGPQQVQIIKGK